MSLLSSLRGFLMILFILLTLIRLTLKSVGEPMVLFKVC